MNLGILSLISISPIGFSVWQWNQIVEFFEVHIFHLMIKKNSLLGNSGTWERRVSLWRYICLWLFVKAPHLERESLD